MIEKTEQPIESCSQLQVELWPLARLIPSPRNARTHSEALRHLDIGRDGVGRIQKLRRVALRQADIGRL